MDEQLVLSLLALTFSSFSQVFLNHMEIIPLTWYEITLPHKWIQTKGTAEKYTCQTNIPIK